MSKNAKTTHPHGAQQASAPSQEAFALLLRVSTAKQKNIGTSLEVQEELACEYVKKRGGTVVRIYKDSESATKRLEDRPMLRSLLDDARTGLFNAVLVQEETRLARDAGVGVVVAQIFRELNITLHTLSGPVDLDSDNGELIFILKTFFGGKEANRGSGKSIEGRLSVLRKGGIAAGRPPYGRTWDKEKQRFEIIQEKREQIKRAYDLIVKQGRSMRFAAAKLDMAESSLRKAIDQAGSTITQHLGGQEFTIPCLPLITAEKQRQLVQRLARNATVRPESKNEYLLQGLVRCAGCGRSMTGQTSTKDGRSHMLYRHPGPATGEKLPAGCAWMAPVKLLDDHVLRACAYIVDDGEALRNAIRAAIAQVDSGQADLAERVADLERLIAAADRKVAKQADAFVEAEPGAMREKIKEENKRTERRLADLRAERGELSGQLTVIELPKGGADAIAAKLRSLYWGRGVGPKVVLPFAQQKEFVRVIVNRADRKSANGVFVKMSRRPGAVKKDVSWSYELHGAVGIADGALSQNEADFSPDVKEVRVPASAVKQLAAIAAATPGIHFAKSKTRTKYSSDD